MGTRFLEALRRRPRWGWVVGGAAFVYGIPGTVDDGIAWWRITGNNSQYVPWLLAAAGFFLSGLTSWAVWTRPARGGPAAESAFTLKKPSSARDVAYPQLLPDALDHLRGVRDRLRRAEIAPTAAELENVLAEMHRAIHGPGVRVHDSPVYLSRLDSVPLIIEEIDRLIEKYTATASRTLSDT